MAEGPQRRLAAIMFTDMVGFTALTQSDEAQALRVLERHNQLLRQLFPQYHGREVKAIGDSLLVEFDSALEATNCAIAIQNSLRRHNSTAAELDQIHVRIGLHLGDVIHAGGDVYGDAVNIASRIEPLAESGGICISEPVFAQVRNKLDATFERLPASNLKNLRFPVEVYQLRGAAEPETVAANSRAPPATHRLAVLPFSNLSPDPQDEFFADGLTEELITELARVPGCQVIARTSVMIYKGAPKGIKDVGRELHVDVALEGSVRKSGNRIRVTAQLIDTRSEAHVWANRYDREFGEIFELQSEIASSVAGALKVELEPRILGTLGKPITRNLAAYELYLKGRQYWWQSGEANYRTAIRHFEKAIELDPTFALAYCGLADSHALLGNHGFVPLQAALELVEAAARRALEIDPNLADGHVSLAPVLYNRYEWAGAEEELRRAIALDSNSVLGHYWLAVAIAVRGKLGEALELTRKLAALDPLARQSVLAPAMYLYLLHDYEGSIAHLEDVERRLGYRSDAYLGRCDLGLGRFDAAVEHLRVAASGVFENDPTRRAFLAIAYARAGKTEESERLLGKLRQDVQAGRAPAGAVAEVYAALGENDRAFEWFDRAFEERTVLGVEDLKSEPLLDGFRKDRRFPLLLQKFRLEP